MWVITNTKRYYSQLTWPILGEMSRWYVNKYVGSYANVRKLFLWPKSWKVSWVLTFSVSQMRVLRIFTKRGYLTRQQKVSNNRMGKVQALGQMVVLKSYNRFQLTNFENQKIDLRCVSDLYHVSAFRDVFKTQSNIYDWAFSQISRFSLWLYWQTLILSCIEIVAQTVLVYAQRYLNTPSKQNVRFSLFFNSFSVLQVLNNQCNWFLNQGIHSQML